MHITLSYGQLWGSLITAWFIFYWQEQKSAKPVLGTVKRWTNETERVLQACFNLTDWTVFESAATNLDELTETVTSYISFCEDMCIPTKTSYHDLFNLQQRQTMVHCKTQTALSGQRRCLQEGGWNLV